MNQAAQVFTQAL